MNKMSNSSESQNNEIESNNRDIVYFYHLIIEQYRIFFGSIVLTTLIALLYALLATPYYIAKVEVVAATNYESSASALSRSASGLASSLGLGGFGGSSSKVETALAILRSRKFIESFIRDEELMDEFNPDDWNESEKKWRSGEEPSMENTYSNVVDDLLSVDNDLISGVITVSFKWTDPNDAAVWANTLISRLNEALRIQAIEDGNNKIYFIREELERTNTLPTKSTLNFLIEEEIRNIVLANVSKEFAFKIIDPATAPEKKYSPRRTNIVILGFMFGIILGFALIILNNFISKTDFSKN